MIRTLIVLASALVLTACVGDYPQSVSAQGSGDSMLVVESAPAGAILRVDGIAYGDAASFGKRTPLGVTPGRHKVEMISGGRVVFSEDVFVGEGGQASVAY